MADIDWQAKSLPEICMSVHMHHIAKWNAHANGRRWAAFDTAVLALCFVTTAEARYWLAERAAIGMATISDMAALPIK